MFVPKANWDFPRSVPLKGNARETSGKDQLSQPNCPGISPTFHGRELCALPVVTYKMIQRYETRVKCRSHVTTFNDISIQAGNARRRWSTRYCLERPYLPHQAGGQTRHACAERTPTLYVFAVSWKSLKQVWIRSSRAVQVLLMTNLVRNEAACEWLGADK